MQDKKDRFTFNTPGQSVNNYIYRKHMILQIQKKLLFRNKPSVRQSNILLLYYFPQTSPVHQSFASVPLLHLSQSSSLILNMPVLPQVSVGVVVSTENAVPSSGGNSITALRFSKCSHHSHTGEGLLIYGRKEERKGRREIKKRK